MKEKKYLIYGIAIVLLTIIGVTLAYFITEIEGNKKDVTLNTGDLRVIFNNGEKIEGIDIEPGWSITKTFSIENKSKTEYKYNIVIQDLVNTFVSDNLVYKITSTNNGYNMTDYEVLPKSDTQEDTILTYSTTISGRTKQEYTIEVNFKEEDRNQVEDMGKTITGKIYIELGTEKPVLLSEALLRDNPTISERTDFTTSFTTNTANTLYKTNKTEDGSDVYYFAGTDSRQGYCEYNGVHVEASGHRISVDENNCTSEMKVCHYNDDYIYLGTGTCKTNDGREFDGEVMTINARWIPKEINLVSNWIKFGKYAESSEVRGFTNNSPLTYGKYDTLEECNEAKRIDCRYVWQKGDDIYWRIIRTNEDGSFRLLFVGSRHDEPLYHSNIFSKPNKSTSNGNSTDYIVFNSSRNPGDPLYVGYMYGTSGSLESNRTNENNSTVKTIIDTWYENNLLNDYDKYISKTAIYCNDRSYDSSNYTYSITDNFNYGAYTRSYDNKIPSYKCGANTSNGLFESTQAIADKFSASTTGGGNGQLKYPIALMTADEVMFAGKNWVNVNSDGKSLGGFWTLSPFGKYGKVKVLLNFFPELTNSNIGVSYPSSVRPVISLSPCIKVTGSGTPDDPYVVNEKASTC